MYKIVLSLCLFAACYLSNAQRIDGHWYGIGKLQTSQTYHSYLSEFVLNQKGNNVSGEFLYYFKDSLVKTPITGTYDDESHRVFLKPFRMMYYLSPTAQNSIDCLLSGNFDLAVSKEEVSLSGVLRSDANHKYTVPNISLRLIRSDDTLDWAGNEPEPIYDTIALVSQPAIETVAGAPAKREKIYAKELEVTNEELKIELYDNGQIDYDSVSLYLNDKRVLSKTKLDHRAIRLTIKLDRSLEFNELSMFAENLGMIPPNTAAMIVYDGKTRHELLLTSDLNKSATIKLKTKSPLNGN